MKGIVLGLLAETQIHPGIGQEEGAIDLPVAREEPFGYPCVPYRGVKGGLRESAWRPEFEKARERLKAEGQTDEAKILSQADGEAEKKAGEIFGTDERAGHLIPSDARLLLLPVRSFPGSYKWVTCSYVLERFRRDLIRAEVSGAGQLLSAIPAVSDREVAVRPPTPNATNQGAVPPAGPALPGQCAMPTTEKSKPIFLEDLMFDVKEDESVDTIAAAIGSLIGDEDMRKRLPELLTIVEHNVFAYLCRTALAVTAHNKLTPLKASENLFYEETIPADTVMYLLMTERIKGGLDHLDPLINDDPYLRFGGNETVGQGWFRVARFALTAAASGGAS